MTLDQILDCLNRKRVRATYGAVGAVIGRPVRGVGSALGDRTRRASWVVNARTGRPTGYARSQLDPYLTSIEQATSSRQETSFGSFAASAGDPGTCLVSLVFNEVGQTDGPVTIRQNGAVHTRLRWSRRFPFAMRGTTREAGPDY